MILEHYSAAPLGEIEPRSQEVAAEWKPRGLWVSVQGEFDWPQWCRAEEFHLEHLTHVTRFRLTAGANVLHLESEQAIDTFHAEFRRTMHPGSIYELIGWDRVADRYDGIVISPYQWGRRLDGPAKWYYSWDCASGCIWNPAALERLP